MDDFLWYCSGSQQIDAAIRIGFLSLLESSMPSGSRPAIFFSPEPLDSVAAILARNGVTPARVAVRSEAAPYTWKEFSRLSGARSRALDVFKQSIRTRMGLNPLNLRVSFQPVPLQLWTLAEVWDGNAWNTHPDFPKALGPAPAE